ncbi:hypothetical protein RYX36_018960 [Vicia faba]
MFQSFHRLTHPNTPSISLHLNFANHLPNSLHFLHAHNNLYPTATTLIFIFSFFLLPQTPFWSFLPFLTFQFLFSVSLSFPSLKPKPLTSSSTASRRRTTVRATAVETLDKTAEVSLVEKSVNTIRFLAIDAVEKANSGHPGLPMGCAPVGHILYDKIMRYNPSNPSWFNRDRFVLSAGHGCMLQYALLHLAGYHTVKEEDLKHFRQWGSKTPGHPENFETYGIEVTTGPLGQGIANGVGLALAEKHLAARFNKPDSEIVDHYTYVILGDGCQMEGILNEACSLAGHWGLGKLIALYHDNHISIDGDTEIAFTENVDQRFEALGWHVIWVKNGNTGCDEIRAHLPLSTASTFCKRFSNFQFIYL